ncbi:unnamed protein product [Lactuca saligna]|uniref:Uncharacterized protein n=1 Tax=Lactuca saligna TaxID=75948 RepID=A0AA35YVS8_LACSI|nr:unnamed protein product [Lactuca saligna]
MIEQETRKMMGILQSEALNSGYDAKGCFTPLKQQGAFAKGQTKTAHVEEEVPPLLGENGKIEKRRNYPRRIFENFTVEIAIFVFTPTILMKRKKITTCAVGLGRIASRTGKDIIDGVVVDEEAVGSGAKILHGEAALAHYLSQHLIGNLEGIFAPGVTYLNSLSSFFASKCNMSFGSTCHEQIHWAHKRCHGFDQLFLAETLDVVQDIDWVISLGNAFAKQYELYTYDDEHSALLHRKLIT